MDINRVTLVGRLTRDPERTTIRPGHAVTRFAIATNQRSRTNDGKESQEWVEFHAVSLRGALADKVAAYLKRGKRVLVEGRLHYDAPGTTGVEPRAGAEIVGDTLVLLDPKPAAPAEGQGKA